MAKETRNPGLGRRLRALLPGVAGKARRPRSFATAQSAGRPATSAREKTRHWISACAGKTATVLPGAVALGVLAQLPSAWADDGSRIRFEVAPGISADARLLEAGWIDAGTGRSPQRQRLQAASDEEGRSRLDHGDYDFDGYQDLVSTATVGQVNEAVVVHLYDPASGRFRELAPPTGVAVNCEGFWSLSPDAASRTLTSSCRSGPMWYSDVYRYDGPRLYLFRSMRVVRLDAEELSQVLALDVPAGQGPLAVWSTYAPSGSVLERAIGDGLELPDHAAALRGNAAVVVPARLPLHAHAGDASTRRYLVAGDRVELLDEAGGWLQLRYRNPSRGPVLGWVKLPGPP